MEFLLVISPRNPNYKLFYLCSHTERMRVFIDLSIALRPESSLVEEFARSIASFTKEFISLLKKFQSLQLRYPSQNHSPTTQPYFTKTLVRLKLAVKLVVLYRIRLGQIIKSTRPALAGCDRNTG
jgi:hypothetical protein